MKIKSTILFLAVILLLTNNLFAQHYLWVEDPQSPWRDGRGTIEEAVISIKPAGIYMEYGLYLTFSARSLGFTNSDTLEVQFYFELPNEAIVHDSWLWVGDDIIRGEILDKWTAASIYDTIVNRRQDPSILFKRDSERYELRIFPMAGDESRKVKITYLVPTQWNSDFVMASLPTNLLAASKFDVSTLNIITWLDENWQNPAIVEFPNINFQSLSDTLLGNYYSANIHSESLDGGLNFSLKSPLINGIYLNNYNNGDENLYQLVFLPSDALNIEAQHKVAVLFDYNSSNSEITKENILNTVKTQLHATLAPTDSFNLIFSQLGIFRVSEEWIPADSQSIQTIFDQISENTISNYSNLPALLANGVDFINKNGNNGSILLVSNSDQLGNFEPANQLINDLLNLMNPIIPIHIADFQTQNLSYNWIGNRYYRGSEYFYTNISRLTSANYYRMYRTNISFSELINLSFNSLGGFINSFELHTTLQNGFCFGRYNINSSGFTTYLNKPILQIGKYNGSLPFIIEANGVYKSQPFSQRFSILEDDIHTADSLLEEMWAGNFIKSLESEEQTNSVISTIVDESLNKRVLSIYSAFLCLDPERGGEICYDCFDETQLVSVQEDSTSETDSTIILKTYPNPFNSQVTIKVNLKEQINVDHIKFNIYNMLGQLVRTFKPNAALNQKAYTLKWDGTNNFNTPVASGTYIFVVQTPKERFATKLLFVK